MARITPRPPPTQTLVLSCLNQRCPGCEGPLWFAYENFRKITTLDAVLGLTLQIRRCVNPACRFYHRPYRPESEGRLARTFWDFYRQMKEFKDMLTPHFWQEFRRAFDGLIQLIGETCQINLPVELGRRIKSKEKAKMEYLRAELAELKKKRYLPGMTEGEFKLIRGLLHPDRYPAEEQQRYARAFEAFNRLGLMVTGM